MHLPCWILYRTRLQLARCSFAGSTSRYSNTRGMQPIVASQSSRSYKPKAPTGCIRWCCGQSEIIVMRLLFFEILDIYIELADCCRPHCLMRPTAGIMGKWQGASVLVALCTVLALWACPLLSATVPSNPLPPSNPKCVDFAAWSTPQFMPKNCYTVLARFTVDVVDRRPITPYEFLAPGIKPTAIFSPLVTPRKYYYGQHYQCTNT